ncbi:MAG: Lrp/AsnC family transcriptional regulator [Pseudohongiellaceae bacterium]
MQLDQIDRQIINSLQEGFPITEQPYAEVAEQLSLSENELIARLERLLADRVLTRFGPMFQAEKLGGAFTLVAMSVREDDFERVAEIVNSFTEVAHNYEREHHFNMWFVVATDDPKRIDAVLTEIEVGSGYSCYNMPKQDEYFVKLKLVV